MSSRLSRRFSRTYGKRRKREVMIGPVRRMIATILQLWGLVASSGRRRPSWLARGWSSVPAAWPDRHLVVRRGGRRVPDTMHASASSTGTCVGGHPEPGLQGAWRRGRHLDRRASVRTLARLGSESLGRQTHGGRLQPRTGVRAMRRSPQPPTSPRHVAGQGGFTRRQVLDASASRRPGGPRISPLLTLANVQSPAVRTGRFEQR